LVYGDYRGIEPTTRRPLNLAGWVGVIFWMAFSRPFGSPIVQEWTNVVESISPGKIDIRAELGSRLAKEDLPWPQSMIGRL
jgi:hypothetical protein